MRLCRPPRSRCRWGVPGARPAPLTCSVAQPRLVARCSPAPPPRFYTPRSGAGGSSRPGGAGCPRGQPRSGPPPLSPLRLSLSCLRSLLDQRMMSKLGREVPPEAALLQGGGLGEMLSCCLLVKVLGWL